MHGWGGGGMLVVLPRQGRALLVITRGQYPAWQSLNPRTQPGLITRAGNTWHFSEWPFKAASIGYDRKDGG